MYEDPTFNEEYLLDGTGDPLSPADLLTLSTNGQAESPARARSCRSELRPEPYIAVDTYMNEAIPMGW